MSLNRRAALAREALEALKEPFASLRERAVRDFSITKPEDDAGRLAAWAMMRALDQIETELRRPIDDYELFEASQGSTS